MSGSVMERSLDVPLEIVAGAEEPRDAPRRSSSATEADKVRRTQALRRKTVLARRALTANRRR